METFPLNTAESNQSIAHRFRLGLGLALSQIDRTQDRQANEENLLEVLQLPPDKKLTITNLADTPFQLYSWKTDGHDPVPFQHERGKLAVDQTIPVTHIYTSRHGLTMCVGPSKWNQNFLYCRDLAQLQMDVEDKDSVEKAKDILIDESKVMAENNMLLEAYLSFLDQNGERLETVVSSLPQFALDSPEAYSVSLILGGRFYKITDDMLAEFDHHVKRGYMGTFIGHHLVADSSGLLYLHNDELQLACLLTDRVDITKKSERNYYGYVASTRSEA